MDVCGKYDRHGYCVYTSTGYLLYQAGNSPFGSQQDVTGFACVLPIETIRQYCLTTCADIAEENKGKVLNIVCLEGEDK